MNVVQLSVRRCPLKVVTTGFVRAEPEQERQTLPASRRRQTVSSIRLQRHQGFNHIPVFAQGPRSGGKADSRRQEQISTGGQRTEGLVEASGSTLQLMGRGPGRPAKTGGSPHGQGGAVRIEPATHGPRPGPPITSFTLSRPDPARSVTFFGSAWPGPDHRPMTSPEKNRRLESLLVRDGRRTWVSRG